MFDHLKKLRWGWIVIAAAYGVGVMPLDATSHLLWASLATFAAYLVLAARTTHTTAQMARDAHESPWRLWRMAVGRTWKTPLLLVIPLARLGGLAITYIDGIYPCTKILEAYCFSMGVKASPQGWEQELLGILIPTIIVLLDHGLLVALTLLMHKSLARSPVFVGRAAVALRVGLACLILGCVSAVVLNFYEINPYWGYAMVTRTQRRIVETVYPAFEPLVSGGVLLVSNIRGRPTHCIMWDRSPVPDCVYWSETRFFVARQMAVLGLAAILYVVLTMGVLHRATRVQRDPRKKAKRGLTMSQPARPTRPGSPAL